MINLQLKSRDDDTNPIIRHFVGRAVAPNVIIGIFPFSGDRLEEPIVFVAGMIRNQIQDNPQICRANANHNFGTVPVNEQLDKPLALAVATRASKSSIVPT